MKLPLVSLALLLPVALCAADAPQSASQKSAPIHALLITGGCCHDYAHQSAAFMEGVKPFADVVWTVVNEGGTGTVAKIPLYDDPNWAKPYDVVVHNECFADVDDADYIRKITAAHRAGKPAVVIHCAMHTYRVAKVDDWREFLGVTSRRHDHADKYVVDLAAPENPIMEGFPKQWHPPVDELYVIEKLWPGAKALATSVSKEDGHTYPVVWCNDYHGTRVFGTTFGHGNDTWNDPVFITLVSRGLVWAAGRDK